MCCDSGQKPPRLSAPKQTLLRRDISKAIAFHIAKDMVPISTVGQSGFAEPLKTLNPRYHSPIRNFFTREARPKIEPGVRASLAARLAKVSLYALTTSMWSSRTCEPYMSVAVYFEEGWQMKSSSLQTSYFPHIGEHIAQSHPFWSP